jgi:hypothetical protein
MRSAILLVAVLIATTGCDKITSSLKGDAGATAEGSLPAECETFLTRYACFLKKQGKPTTEADDMRAQWIGPSSQPASRPAIQNACTTQLTAQAQNFKNAGCDDAATAPIAQAVADAGKAEPALTCKPGLTSVKVKKAQGVESQCQRLCTKDRDCGNMQGCGGTTVVPGQLFCTNLKQDCKPGEKLVQGSAATLFNCVKPCKADADCPTDRPTCSPDLVEDLDNPALKFRSCGLFSAATAKPASAGAGAGGTFPASGGSCPANAHKVMANDGSGVLCAAKCKTDADCKPTHACSRGVMGADAPHPMADACLPR